MTNLKFASMILGLGGLMGPAVIHGQNVTNLVAKVPFDFRVGETSLSAGSYNVRELTRAGVAQLRNTKTGQAMMIAATRSKGSNSAGTSKLVFNCYGGKCFLSQIWYEDDPTVHALWPSKVEKEIARGPQTSVIVAMR